MDIFYNRPLAFGSFCFIIMFCIGFFISSVAKSALFITAILIWLILPQIKGLHISKYMFNSAILFVMLALLCSHFYTDLKINKAVKLASENPNDIHTVEARVISHGEYDSCTNADIEVMSVDGKKYSFRSELVFSYAPELENGDILRLNLHFSEYERDDNRGLFSEKLSKLSDGYVLKSNADEASSKLRIISRDNSFSLDSFAGSLRSDISRIFKNNLSSTEQSFVSALMIGEKSELPNSIKNSFSYLGLSHIIAISGMHFSLIFGMLAVILVRCGVDKKLRSVILILLSISYMILCGLIPSVTRAGIMFILATLCSFLGRESDSFTSLMFAVCLIIIFDPASIFDIGLMLSFSATLGIITAIPLTNRISHTKFFSARPVLRFILLSVMMSVSAVSFSLPVSILAFSELSIISPLSTMLFSPFITVIMVLSLLLVIFSFFPAAAAVISSAISFICKIVFGGAKLLFRIKGLTISLDYPFVPYVLVAAAIILTVLFFINPKKKPKGKFWYLVPFVFAFVTVICLSFIYPKEVIQNSYTYTHSNNSDYAYTYSRGRVSVIDSGNSDYDSGIEFFGHIAEQCKTTDIDAYVLRSLNKDHINSIKYFSSKVNIRKIYAPSPTDSKSLIKSNKLIDVCSCCGIDICFIGFNNSGSYEIKSGDMLITLYGKNNQSGFTKYTVGKKDDINALLFDSGRTFNDKETPGYSVLVFGIDTENNKNCSEYEISTEPDKIERIVYADQKAKSYFSSFRNYIDRIEVINEGELFTYGFDL